MSTSQKSKLSKAQGPKSFNDHIGELRVRVMWVALAFVITSALAYQYRDILISIVLSPLGHQKLVYLTPAGGFAFIFQITMYAGAVVTAPVFIYQLYKFVQPALPKRATSYSLRIVFASTLLMLGGVAFGYFVAVPSALHFLTSFADAYVEASLTADSYLNFIVAYVVGLGLLFQLPLLLVFWNWISPMSGKKLFSTERFVILFSFIAAAMITPTPDPVNQAMIAVPILIIYQIGVISVILINRQNPGRLQRAEASAATAHRANRPATVMPTIPALPTASQTVAITIPAVPSATLSVAVTPQPVRRPGAMMGGIDGIRRTRPSRLEPVKPRPQAHLTPPSRPMTVPLNRRTVSLDGVSRVFSA